MMQNKRSLYWDTLKGFLIILVVLGHCGTALPSGIISAIYAFHMPLFILVSGYFSKKQGKINWGGYKRLIIIYIMFNTAYILLDMLTVGVSFKRLLTPSFALWYILSLIYWRLILQVIPQSWIEKTVPMLAVSFLISLLAGFIPIGGEMSFQRAVTFWPFFIIGYYLRQFKNIDMIRKQNRWMAVSVLVVLLTVSYIGLDPFYANTPYHFERYAEELYMRGIQLVIGLLISLSIMNLLPERMGQTTQMGQFTLLIYLLHPPMVKLLKVLSSRLGYQPDFWIAILITILTVTTIYGMRRLKLLKYLV